MMNKLVDSFCGELKRRPYPNKASVAQMQVMPLINLHDHEVMCEFKSHTVPVFINVSEHYQLLASLVEKTNELWSEINILVRFSMPGGTQIPPVLLKENVLILQDVNSEEVKLSKEEKRLLVIDDNFAHFEVDNGDNQIGLRLYTHERQKIESLSSLVEILLACGVCKNG